jgi:hypothetical protein
MFGQSVFTETQQNEHRMKFRGVISLLLLLVFIAAAWDAGWWLVMGQWDKDTRAIVVFIAAIAWSISNDFGSGG